MPFSLHLNTELVAAAFGGAAYSPVPDYYVGLSTTTPTQSGGSITEPLTADGYARVTVPNNGTNWVVSGTQPASGYQVQNALAIIFPTATASWGTPTDVVIYDAATGGNLIAWGAISNPQAINTNDSPSFGAGALTVSNN